tara:strand:- start:120 stop:419 length:300 start_codon:yes stop_codon:yes gene_type:complete
MSEEEVLALMYRCLRDSISSSIAHVDYNKKEESIYLTLKGRPMPYPYNENSKESGETLAFDGSVWKIDKDGVSNCSVQKKHKKISWIKRFFGEKNEVQS